MKKSWQIFWHVLFWVSIISFFLFIVHDNSKMTVQRMLVIFGLYGCINISLFYLNYLFFIPVFLNRKRYGMYAVAIALTIVAYGIGKYGIGVLFKEDVLMHMRDRKEVMIGFWD